MKCPHCENKITYVINENSLLSDKPKKRIIFRPMKGEDGKLIWKNLFYIEPAILIIVIGIILLLIGFNQINEQCYEILEKPCDVIDRYNCKGLQQTEFDFGDYQIEMPSPVPTD